MSNIYKVNSLEDYKKQREKKEGLKNLFLERIDPKKSREEIKQQLISALKKTRQVQSETRKIPKWLLGRETLYFPKRKEDK